MPASMLLPSLSALLTICGIAGTALVYLVQGRKIRDEERERAGREWQSVAEAHEARVGQLTSEVAELGQRQRDLTAKVESMETDRQFLLKANLELQRRLSRAMHRIGALEARLTAARVPLPSDDDDRGDS